LEGKRRKSKGGENLVGVLELVENIGVWMRRGKVMREWRCVMNMKRY
jgi:hypothetical protein